MESFNFPVDPKIQSEMNEVAIRRGNIIANFAFIESLISNFVIMHYIKDEKLVSSFQQDIFEDEFFSYILKFNLFKKVLSKYYTQDFKKFPIDQFRQLSKIRNIIAHASIVLFADRKTKKVLTQIMFNHNGEKFNAQEKMDEYDVLKNKIQPQLQNLASSLELFNITMFNEITRD